MRRRGREILPQSSDFRFRTLTFLTQARRLLESCGKFALLVLQFFVGAIGLSRSRHFSRNDHDRWRICRLGNQERAAATRAVEPHAGSTIVHSEALIAFWTMEFEVGHGG